MITPRSIRRWFIRILQDTEDELESLVPVIDADHEPTLWELRDNHMHHQAIAINSLHVRVGRIEAKTGLILAILFGLFGLALQELVKGWFF